MNTKNLLSTMTLLCLLVFAAAAIAQAPMVFDYCTNFTSPRGFSFEDSDSDATFSAGDEWTAVGLLLPEGTIPDDGIGVAADCSDVRRLSIGFSYTQGRSVLGLPYSGATDGSYLDAHWVLRRSGQIAFTGVTPADGLSGNFELTVLAGEGPYRNLTGTAVLVPLNPTGWQGRVFLPGSVE